MGKKKGSSGSGEAQYSITQRNLDNKGKTNKKLKRNSMASKYLTSFGKELKEKAEAEAKRVFKTGRRTKIKEQRAKEAAEKEAQWQAEQAKKKAEQKNRNSEPRSNFKKHKEVNNGN